MKKRTASVLFFILVFSSLTVSAKPQEENYSLDVSPKELNFNINLGEESCQLLSLSSGNFDGAILIKDFWTRNIEEENVTLYNQSSSEQNISISYINTVIDFAEELELEVCLEAENQGEYKGALLFSTKTSDKTTLKNVSIILVNAEEQKPQQEQPVAPVSSGGGGSSVSKKTVQNQNTIANKTETPEIEELSTPSENTNQTNEKTITGSTVNQSDRNNSNLFLPLVLIAVLVTIAVLIKTRKAKISSVNDFSKKEFQNR